MLKPYARSLTGVDLSPGMLAKARAREAYDRLHEDEITHFLAANVAFDVIASADTAVLLRRLGTPGPEGAPGLRAGGWIGFTVERSDKVEIYRIQPHGRYSHGAIMSSVLAQAGFEAMQVTPAVLRRELGSDVEGWVVRARVPG